MLEPIQLELLKQAESRPMDSPGSIKNILLVAFKHLDIDTVNHICDNYKDNKWFTQAQLDILEELRAAVQADYDETIAAQEANKATKH